MSDPTIELGPGDREAISCDVLIVGAGPAGLAAAIRIKQIDPAVHVVVLEKGAEVGAQIVSGAVIDPSGLDALLPGGRAREDFPKLTTVSGDRFSILTAGGGFTVPGVLMPPLMSNHGNLIGSLGEVCRWLAGEAEKLGVEIYAGFAGSALLVGEGGEVIGVATGDMGRLRDGEPGPNFQRGIALLAKYTLLAEGARGSLTKTAIARFGLAATEPAKFGLGLKEIWEVAPEHHRPGFVQHTMGWPLKSDTGGGGFIYHYGENQVAIGFVVHLGYANPYISPYEEFQRFKTHPSIKPMLESGRRVGYAGRAITEGGWQSVPKLCFPGGALLGCAAGFVNVPRIKGSHNAVLSGIAAANAVCAALAGGRHNDELADYEGGWRDGPIGRDLYPVRNVKPLWSRFGTLVGVGLAGLDMWVNTIFRGWSPFGTMRHGKSDAAALRPAKDFAPIDYPRADGKVTFDRMSSVYLTNTNHAEDEPVHLQVLDPHLQKASEHDVFAGPSARYCPAGVYEWRETGAGPQFVINAQNCIHCKTCDIKDPNGNINWVPPQGGEGPIYPNM
jgi:electron-transferring-flavoprotein dehydrogenase